MKYWIKLLFVLFLLSSCGARKTQVSTEDIKIEATTNVTEEVSQVSEKTESLVDTTSIIEEEFEPINDSLPMVIDKKNGIFKNARYKTSKTKKGITIAKKEESSLDAKKSTLNETSIDIQTKDKESERESNFPWWLILVIIGIILGYLEYKK
jgi:uncharacterized protein YcfL